jgi:hypothetical protein
MGESNEIIDDHLEQSKLKLNYSGINLYSREVVCALVDSFVGGLNSWAFDKATSINGLNTVSTLGTFMDIGYVIEEDLVASKIDHLQRLIKLDQNCESLLDYTRAFNCSYND